MPCNLRNRSILSPLDFSGCDLRQVLSLARELKRAKYGGYETPHLCGKNIALIFERPAMGTRCAFEIAAHDQGANVTYLDPSGSHIGEKESTRDTARVLGRLYDAIEYRGSSQHVAEELAKHAGVPVFNGLTDEYHPTRMAADLMTMREHAPKPWHDISYCYVGDGRSSMGNSLMIAGCLMGMDVRIAAPKGLWPDAPHLARARELVAKYKGRLTLTEDPREGVRGVDFIHTDARVPLDEAMDEAEERLAQRIELLRDYQVNAALMEASGNELVRFMHRLPAFHNLATRVGRDMHERFGLAAMEVTEEVFESPAGIQFEQAENHVHAIKALLVASLGD